MFKTRSLSTRAVDCKGIPGLPERLTRHLHIFHTSRLTMSVCIIFLRLGDSNAESKHSLLYALSLIYETGERKLKNSKDNPQRRF